MIGTMFDMYTGRELNEMGFKECVLGNEWFTTSNNKYQSTSYSTSEPTEIVLFNLVHDM